MNSFEGMIGAYPIHMSIQLHNTGSNNTAYGSYYYDKYPSPIALYGVEEKGNDIKLCEVSDKDDFENFIVVGKKYDINKCPFRLKKVDGGLNGVWVNGGRKFGVFLKEISEMNRAKVKSQRGIIEIPFWGQTKQHSFIGIYEERSDELYINKINVIEKTSGNIIQIINPQSDECGFGFYMTAIFQNLGKMNDSVISLSCYSTRADISVEYKFKESKNRYERVINQRVVK